MKKASSPDLRLGRKAILALAILLIAGGLGIWKLGMPGIGKGDTAGNNGGPSTSSASAEGDAEDGGPHSTKSNRTPRIGRTASENGEVKQFPLVQRILADESLSGKQAGAELAGIARRTDISEEERFEALAHACNLDFKSVLGLAEDTSLPVGLAQRFLDELANRNHFPKEQIVGCLSLMNHSDAEIRDQATQQLAFLLEAEALASSPEALRKAASEKIKAIEATPADQDQALLEAPGEK